MVKIKQNINKHSITVVSNNRNASVLASTDSTMYYSNLSKEWACKMPASVDGTEYSAKYYMEKTKQEAIDSKADLQASCSQNISDMNDIKDNAVASLQALCSQNISDMNDIKDNAVADLQAAGDDILDSATAIYDDTADIKTELLNLASTFADVDLSNISSEAKKVISSMSMPSSRYIDLTLGASGTTYTAPADGWYAVRITSTGGTGIAYVIMSSSELLNSRDATYHPNNNANYGLYTSIPAPKGSVVTINYSVMPTVSNKMLRFIYAESS